MDVAGARGGVGRGDGGGGAAGSLGGCPTGVVGAAGSAPPDWDAVIAAITAAAIGTAATNPISACLPVTLRRPPASLRASVAADSSSRRNLS